MNTPYIFSESSTKFLIQNFHRLGPTGVAKILGVTAKIVAKKRDTLKKKGIYLRIDRDVLSKITVDTRLAHRKKLSDYAVNVELFQKIACPETAYLLGFLWADGYVALGSKDKKYTIGANFALDDFRDIEHVFDFHGKWGKSIFKADFRKDQIRIRTVSKPLGELLASLGYRSKTLSADKILSCIPEDLLCFWFRGFFDGDGSIFLRKNKPRVSFYGPREQNWCFLERLCRKLKATYRIYRRTNNTGSNSTFSLRSYEDCHKILKYLFQGRPFGLMRKYEKYLMTAASAS